MLKQKEIRDLIQKLEKFDEEKKSDKKKINKLLGEFMHSHSDYTNVDSFLGDLGRLATYFDLSGLPQEDIQKFLEEISEYDWSIYY